MPELKPGEKYLTIDLLDGNVRVNAFPVKDRKKGSPHFRGNGVSVWVNEKQEKEEKQQESPL